MSLPEAQWSWRPLAALPSWHNGSVAPVIRDTIFLPVAYGMDTDKTFHPASQLWLGWEGEEGRGRASRDRPGVGVLGEQVYMVGGAAGRELLGLVEVWEEGGWREVAPLTHPREGPGVVGHGGKLYVIGENGDHVLVEKTSVEAVDVHYCETLCSSFSLTVVCRWAREQWDGGGVHPRLRLLGGACPARRPA